MLLQPAGAGMAWHGMEGHGGGRRREAGGGERDRHRDAGGVPGAAGGGHRRPPAQRASIRDPPEHHEGTVRSLVLPTGRGERDTGKERVWQHLVGPCYCTAVQYYCGVVGGHALRRTDRQFFSLRRFVCLSSVLSLSLVLANWMEFRLNYSFFSAQVFRQCRGLAVCTLRACPLDC